jgi:hypothetical protein
LIQSLLGIIGDLCCQVPDLSLGWHYPDCPRSLVFGKQEGHVGPTSGGGLGRTHQQWDSYWIWWQVIGMLGKLMQPQMIHSALAVCEMILSSHVLLVASQELCCLQLITKEVVFTKVRVPKYCLCTLRFMITL